MRDEGAEEQAAVIRPRRRRLRLGLRGLMVVVAPVGLVLGKVGYEASRQRRAVAAIEASGGSVRYDWQLNAKGLIDLRIKQPWPEWLVNLVGIDALSNVIEVNLSPKGSDQDLLAARVLRKVRWFNCGGAQLSDASLAILGEWAELERLTLANQKALTGSGLLQLKPLVKLNQLYLTGVPLKDEDLGFLQTQSQLEFLELSATGITDQGIVQIASLKKIKRLFLNGTAITSKGLEPISTLPDLIWLALNNTKVDDLSACGRMTKLQTLSVALSQVSDQDLSALKRLENLQSLILTGTKVSDAGLQHLVGLKNLAGLSLDRCRVTDEGLSQVASLSGLTGLTLRSTAVTDNGLSRLCPLQKLRTLDISETNITDAGLTNLACLTNLASINAQGATKLTDEGAEAFNAKRPSVKLIRIARRPNAASSRNVGAQPPKGR